MPRTGKSTRLLTIVAVMIVLLFTISTGAAIFDGQRDSLNENISIQPGDNPFASLNEDDELVINITGTNDELDSSGVNQDGLTIEENIFFLAFNGSEPAKIWINTGSPAVTFIIEGQEATSEDNAANITPRDEPIPVDMQIDTRVVEATSGQTLINEVTINAEPVQEPTEPDPTENSLDAIIGVDDEAVTLSSPDQATREVEVLSITASEEAEVDLNGADVGSSAVELEQLDFVPEGSGDAQFSVKGSETAPESVEPVTRPGVDPLGYYDVSFEESAPAVTEATAELAVDRSRLEIASVAPDQLAAYHETEGGWEATNLTVLETTEEMVRLAISSDGFSAFALAPQRPALDPVAADPAVETVAPDEPVTVEITVDNVGSAPASNATLQIQTAGGGNDGTPVIDQGTVALAVAADTATTRNVTVRLDEPGEYNLVVEGDRVEDTDPVGTITVTDTAISAVPATIRERDGESTVGADSESANSRTTNAQQNGESDFGGREGAPSFQQAPLELTAADGDRVKAATTEQLGPEGTDPAGLVVLTVTILLIVTLVRRVAP